MTHLLAVVGVAEIIPLLVFVGIVFGIWSVLSMISNRNSRALDRLQRLSRPQSLIDMEDPPPPAMGRPVRIWPRQLAHGSQGPP